MRQLVGGAVASIEAHRRRIDDLNVYPVPDGDTGTNLTLTVRAVADELAKDGPDDRAGLAREIARAALMGARGNSGVILSQIVRGATESLAESDDLRKAFRGASEAAYRAVKKPVEGTMLTAIKSMADAAGKKNADLAQIVAAGDATVERTREMLPVLRDAGVVDAGAAGLVEIVRGIAAALAGEPIPEAPAHEEGLALEAIHQELSKYTYCTVFVVEGDDLDSDALEDELERLGDSLLVVGDRTALKVHVHTDDPGKALQLGLARGTIDGVEIANMHEQTQRREERLLRAVPESQANACAVVAVSTGDGNHRLFESFGAVVVDGGRTMNPSTADLLAALVSFDPALGAEENAASMSETADQVATGAVTIASRDVQLNGVSVQSGDWLGLADGEPVVGGDTFEAVAHDVVERLLGEPRGVLTLLTGAEPQPLEGLVAAIEAEHPEVELEVHEGGQPHYALLLAAE